MTSEELTQWLWARLRDEIARSQSAEAYIAAVDGEIARLNSIIEQPVEQG